MNQKISNETPNDVIICYSSNTCSTCYYYDGKYHGGYCDKHKCDTSPGSTCGNWSRK